MVKTNANQPPRGTKNSHFGIYLPATGIGLTYLIFFNHPYHNKSFELIIRTHGSSLEKEKWLEFIERRAAP